MQRNIGEKRDSCIFNLKYKGYLVLDFILVCISIIILVYRSWYGIDFTDESWYIAEPYIVSEGAAPYANNWNQAPGFTIPLALFVKVYIFFAGSTEGIFLVSRIGYIVWLIAISSLALFFLNRNNNQKIPSIVLCPLLFITPNQIFTINYNTIGLIYLFLASVILFSDCGGLDTKLHFIRGVVVGVIVARATIGTPYIMLPCAIIFFILFVQKEWKKLQGYIGGGITTAVLVVGWCCLKVGIHKFIKGLEFWLNDSAYFNMKIDFFTKNNFIDLFSFFKIFIVCIIFSYIFRLLLKEDDRYEKFLHILLCTFWILGCLQYLTTNSFKTIVYWGWFEPLVLYMFSPYSSKRKDIQLFAFITILYSSVYIFSSFGNVYGFLGREYWLYIPFILSTVIILRGSSGLAQTEILFRIGVIMITFLMIRQSYNFVYRDDPINNLTEKIESGIWKGLYTTKERATAVIELENYIREITEEDEKVLFMDWVSFGYLMSNGQACTSTAYDAMQYTYDVNNSEIMYDYFRLTETVPDKIIYIDFGRDEMLSIEDNKWKFNQFVNKYYDFQNSSESNMFRVVCYELNNRQKALEMSNISVE